MKWTGGLIIAMLLLTGIIFSRCGGHGNVIDTVASPIAQAVNKIKVADSYYNRKIQLKTSVFYRANQYKRAWLKKRRPDKMFKAFINEVQESEQYGFVAEDYRIAELQDAVKALYDNRKRTDADISDVDIRITASFFLFTTHLIEGRVRYPGAKDFLWVRGMPLENDIALLLQMESGSDLRKELQDLHPKDPEYKKLQEALKEYRTLEKADTFPRIRESLTIKPGESNEAIPGIRRKLMLTKYISEGTGDSPVLDEQLVEALKKFQEHHGLEPDGKLDRHTLRFLNIPLRDKSQLIRLNLERLRWHPHVQGKGDEIVVNVPEYMLRVYRNNKEKMKMRVILGAEFTPTPVFHDTLKYIVFSPTWIVPKSIFEKEFLPKLQEDPGHYSIDRFKFYKDGHEIDPFEEPWTEEDLDIDAYRVVENPGDANSLGKVKFIMPNDYSIYLHDTPADQLFERDERALSHGCIRVEKPEELAAYLLSDQNDWTMEKVREAMKSQEPIQVNLPKPIPVYIVYRTAWVDDDGMVNFREDIYGHDERHLARLGSNESGG